MNSGETPQTCPVAARPVLYTAHGRRSGISHTSFIDLEMSVSRMETTLQDVLEMDSKGRSGQSSIQGATCYSIRMKVTGLRDQRGEVGISTELFLRIFLQKRCSTTEEESKAAPSVPAEVSCKESSEVKPKEGESKTDLSVSVKEKLVDPALRASEEPQRDTKLQKRKRTTDTKGDIFFLNRQGLCNKNN